MISKNSLNSCMNSLKNYFQNQTKPVQKTLPLCIVSSALSGSFNMPDLITKMSEINKISFNGNENKLSRFLYSKNFQIDDSMWRNYSNFLFDSLREKGLQDKDNLQVNVDFTTIENKFLILTASVIYGNLTYPLFFSMRNYPKKAGQYDHKKNGDGFLKSAKTLAFKGLSIRNCWRSGLWNF